MRCRQPAALFWFQIPHRPLFSLLSGQHVPVDWRLFCFLVWVFSSKAGLAEGHVLIKQRKVPLTDTDLVIASITL